MPDLLLEVLSEEIPARMQLRARLDLEAQVQSRVREAGLDIVESKSFATPRRLTVYVHSAPGRRSVALEERKGPRVGAPEKAIQGFLKSTGLTLEDCEQRETPKGLFWYAVTVKKRRPIRTLLAESMPEALAAVSWPKSMRWEESGTRWVRPIRSILCLLDDEVVPFRFGTVESGRTTFGHRFLKPEPITVEHASIYREPSYVEMLRKAKVMLGPDQRMEKIEKDAVERAQSKGYSVEHVGGLLAENAGLVEWPVVLMGNIEEEFMSLPAEVLSSAMSTHQRYFSLIDEDDRPAPHFVMVANTTTEDDSTAIVAGNERVLRARLADARFFWDQDTSRSLEDYLPALKGVVFQARLGNMYEKAKRIEKLARALCQWIDGADSQQAARAGFLCKADLVTEMVGEFPDLQGIMGRYYADDSDEEPAVCVAIERHYAPQGPSDCCPRTPVSVAVALADKLDTLAGFFAVDERPTGSKDPFALRRAALGVIRLIIENRLRLSLSDAFTKALAGYDDRLPEEPGTEATKNFLLTFFADRVKVHFRYQNVSHDVVSAVFAGGDEDNLVRLHDRVDALKGFLDGEDGANLLTAYRRAANILRIEEKKDGQHYDGPPDPALFTETEEQVLHNRITEANTRAEMMLGYDSFEEAMTIMATLRTPVDAFFDNVTVNCEDPALRRNRLLMLSQIRATLDRVADFSKIEG